MESGNSNCVNNEDMFPPRDNLMLLSHRYDVDTQDIWREAVRRNWRIERIGSARIDIERKLNPRPDRVRYYGNTLLVDEAEKHLPIQFSKIDPRNLIELTEFTQRRIRLIPFRDLTRPIGERVFVKCPYTKWIESRVYEKGETLDGFSIKPDDWIYVQEPIEIIDEIRCFVLKGEILTASFYRVNREFAPKLVDDMGLWRSLQNLAQKIFAAKAWPDGIVFDFGLTKDKRIVFIEINEAWASGLYHCVPSACFDVIVASQKSFFQ